MGEVLSSATARADRISGDDVVGHPAWATLKQAVEAVRPWQLKDGSIDFGAEGAPSREDAERNPY